MGLYLFSFAIILIVVVAMAIGVLMTGKPIQGNCGGIACKMCSDRGKCHKDKKLDLESA